MNKALPLALSLALTAATGAMAEEMPLSTVLVFDAICLTCHEGECSGRMALRTERSADGLAGHVSGYAGPQDETAVSRLKTLMSRLKTECRLPSPPVAIPPGGRWEPADLARLTLPDRSRLFVPLGRREAGAHAVTLKSERPQRLRLQVVADSFDILFDQETEVVPTGTPLRWRVDEPGLYFLRIAGREPVGPLRLQP
jgi:hypothetical protein